MSTFEKTIDFGNLTRAKTMRIQWMLVGVITILVLAMALTLWNTVQAQPEPVAQQFGLVDCDALDFDFDSLPDVLACGGVAYSLSPFPFGE